jgi:hypothetical protein
MKPGEQMLKKTSNLDEKTIANKQLRPMLQSFRSPKRSVSHAQALAAQRYQQLFL